MPYNICIVETNEISSVSHTGNYIYIYTGLLNALKNDPDALAVAIGHEMAHCALQHNLRRSKMEVLYLVQCLHFPNNFNIADIPSFYINDIPTQIIVDHLSDNSGITDWIKIVPDLLLTPNLFTQHDEYEADEYGAWLAKKAGYNPYKYLHFLQSLEGKENPGIKDRFAHPTNEQRVNCLMEFLTNNGIFNK